jgi:hypothetical protein
MAETIVPVVHGGRRSSYWVTVALHTLAATAAAALLGLALGLAGMLMGAPWGALGAAALASTALLYVLREGFGVPIPIPDRHRQVPDWWRSFFSPPVAALLYGLGLGVGFLTFLTYGTFVVVAAAALLSGDPLLAIALCAPFGLARGLSVTVSRRAESGEAAAAVVDRLERRALGRMPRAVNALALAAIALAALASLAGMA